MAGCGIGITSPIFPSENCPPGQRGCRSAQSGGRPEIDTRKLARVTFYTRTLAVPARRDVGAALTAAGERRFAAIGCAACHRPELRTGASDVAGLRHQTIRPYTDLLLHDMGRGLADGRPDGLANGSEWRTAPLWGIGLCARSTATRASSSRSSSRCRARNLCARGPLQLRHRPTPPRQAGARHGYAIDLRPLNAGVPPPRSPHGLPRAARRGARRDAAAGRRGRSGRQAVQPDARDRAGS